MIKNKQEKKSPMDFKEPYEFILLIDDNIICQRYFKINNFNKNSLTSAELTDTIRKCARMIDEDLKSKTRVYLWHMAPLVFKNETEMSAWFQNPKNKERVNEGENIVLLDEDASEYIWDGENLKLCEKKIYDGTFTAPLTEKDTLTYELAFYVNDRKITSTIFEGVYPHYIRRNIDLSNTRGKFDGEDITRLSFESYILNRLVHDKQDLIKKIVKEICYTCSVQDESYYTQVEKFKTPEGKIIKYNLNINDPKVINNVYSKEIAKAKEYLYFLYGSTNKKK